jgi:hypothetical protein
MKRTLLTLIVLLGLLLAPLTMARSAPLHQEPTPDASEPGPPPDKGQTAERLLVEEAVRQATTNRGLGLYAPDSGVETRVENVQFSADGQWATAWLVPVDPQTGQAIPTEPGLVLAQRSGDVWNVFLRTDPAWPDALQAIPGDLMTVDTKLMWLSISPPGSPEQPVFPTSPFHGYKLPWAYGQTVYLSRSVGHDADYTTSHYAFDFYLPGAMFNIHAVKDGTVWGWRDTVANNDHSAANFIVLEDTTTIPTTYVLYMHLAQGSIPADLKHVGARVLQGQFIAVADNTGASTGHHLHIQVEGKPNWPSDNPYWNTSLDFTFDEVSINGGRPRSYYLDHAYCRPDDACSTFQDAYVSKNTVRGDINEPLGDISDPTGNGFTVNSSNLHLSGWAFDSDSGLKTAQFIAGYGGAWHNVGSPFSSSPFSLDWNLCADGVPDGPVSLALSIADKGGNVTTGLPGLRHFIKNYTCPAPPPGCTPADNQAALFAEPDFGGTCVVLGAGDQTNLGSLGVDNAASIQVGKNAWATTYANNNVSGRGETFSGNGSSRFEDRNLSDNQIGANTVSSVRVGLRGAKPGVPAPAWPADGDSFPGNSSLSLVWEDGGGAAEFQVDWNGALQPWQGNPVLHLGSLAKGSYTWRVKARNSAGESAWSASRSININDAPSYPGAVTAPFFDNMESGTGNWVNSNNWDQTNVQNYTPNGSISWGYEPANATGYDNGKPNTGDLTSRRINIPASGTYYLRFYYSTDTEGPGVNWDQRWVQISVDGGPFTGLLQLSDDPRISENPPKLWLQSPIISLAAYAGHSIQVRFHFETLDSLFNNFAGWYIDDVSINTSPPPSCPDDGNNSPSQATPISYGANIDAKICPKGDLDYYQFSGHAGDQVGVSVTTPDPASTLDPYAFLLDSDGASVLAEDDDIVYAQVKDSFIGYRLPHDGTYFVKVKAWNHPSVGSDSASGYTLQLNYGAGDPNAAIINPPTGTFLPTTPFVVTASASDAAPGMSRVDFFFHDGDWKGSDWKLIGVDQTGSDGWGLSFDPATIAVDQEDMAFYIQAYDLAGNAIASGIWNMAIDRTPPVTSLQPVSGTPNSTAILLTWTGSDNLAGIDHFDLQSMKGGGSWLTQSIANPGDAVRQTWFVGEAGAIYSFRMRGVDRIGNTEAYPPGAETSTSIPSSVCSGGDQFEKDNSATTARLLTAVSKVEQHTFCNPLAANWLNDEDWLKFSLKANEWLLVDALPNGSSAAAVLELYSQAAGGGAGTLLAQIAPGAIGEASRLFYKAPAAGVVLLRMRHLDGRVAGDGASYQVRARQGRTMYLPIIR